MILPLEGLYRYATWDVLPDYLALGWMFSAPASNWSGLVVWLCDCTPKVPA